MNKILLITLSVILNMTVISGQETSVTMQVYQQNAINLAGAEFGQVPGEVDKDYVYPSCEDISNWAEKGFSVIRYRKSL